MRKPEWSSWTLALTLALLLVLGSTVAVMAAPSAGQVLRRALLADNAQTYKGTMVIFSWVAGTGEATVARVYQAPGKSRLEYLTSGNDPYLITLDDGNHRWQYRPQEKTAVIEFSQGFAQDVEEQLALLGHNYNLQYGGSGEVSGRPTEILELVARGCGHPSQRLWVDRQTGVVLRTEQYRGDGSLGALTVFTAFEPVESLPETLFRLKLPRGVRVTKELGAIPLSDLGEVAGLPVRLPARLPAGYVLEGATGRQLGQEPVAHLRFTDGLGVISLFEQEARPFTRYRLAGAREVALKHGRGWLSEECGGYVLNWTSGGLNFTLIGEVPPETLKAIADSIPPGPSPGPLGYLRSMAGWLFGGNTGNNNP